MAELPFGYRDQNPSTQQQISETPYVLANQPRYSAMSEPDVLEAFDFDAFLNNVEEPPPQPPAQPTRMNGNAPSWASSAPVTNYIYGQPPREQVPHYPSSESVYGYTSRNVPPRPSLDTEMVSRQRQSLLATAAAQQAEREALIESLRAQQESPTKSSPPPAKPAVPATRKPVEGECPVCWESFLDKQTILFCKTTCGNNFHKSCIVEWLTAPSNRQALLKCPMCRGPWDDQELKELHQENGITPPRPSKRFRSDPNWAARNQTRDHFRRLHRQRVYERRNSADRSRAAPVAYDSRPNFPGRPSADHQSPQMSPTSPTGPQNRSSPMMPYQMPTNAAFSPVPRPAPPGMVQSMTPNGPFIQVSHIPRPTAFGVPQFMPNGPNATNGLQPARMMPYQFQPPHEVAAYRTQPGPAYPMYPAMTPQNYQPANMMPHFGQMSQNRPQGITATPMQYNTSPLQQHPCPAMRQQAMPMQQQVHPGNFMPQPPSPGSQASWELRQYHYSQTYTVYMNH